MYGIFHNFHDLSKECLIYNIRHNQGRSQDFVIGGAKRKFGGASLNNYKILNIKLRNFYVKVK